MPVYRFELRNGTSAIRDDTGVSLPDRGHALAYAHVVVRELMRGHELQARHWRLDVYGETGERVFEIPFASVDWTLDHMRPELRAKVAETSERVRTLRELVASAKITMRESQALVARSRGRPYLATYLGEHTIRAL